MKKESENGIAPVRLFFSEGNKIKKEKKSKCIVEEMLFVKNMSLGPLLASQVTLRETLDATLFLVKNNRFSLGFFCSFEKNYIVLMKNTYPLTHIIWIRMPKYFGISDIFII